MNNGTQKLIVIALALVCLASVAVGPVAAQDGNMTGNISIGGGDQYGGGNSTGNNSTGNNSSSGGNCGISHPKGCLPGFVKHPIQSIMGSIGDIVTGVLGAFATLLSDALKEPAKWLVELINGIPAPGEIDKPLTWNPGLDANGGPHNAGSVSSPRAQAGGLWNDVYNAWFFTLALSGIILAVSGTWLFTTADPYEYRETGRRWLLALVMSITTWFVAPLALHVTRALALGIAPSGIELATNLGDLGLGVLLAIILLVVAFGVILQAFVILMAQYFLAHILVTLWPLLWSLRATREDTLESIGNSGLYMFGLLCILYVLQAIILRFTFSLDFAAASMGIGSRLFGFAASMVGLYLGLVLLPKQLLSRAMRAGVIGLGAKHMRRRGASLTHGTGIIGYGQAARGKYDRFQDWRSDDDDGQEPPARGNRDEDASPTSGAGGSGSGSARAATDGGRGDGGVDAEARTGSRYGDMSMDETNEDDYDYRDNDKSNYQDGRSKAGRYVGRTPDQNSVRNSRNGRQSTRSRRSNRPDSTSKYTAEALSSGDGGSDMGSRAGARYGSSGSSDGGDGGGDSGGGSGDGGSGGDGGN